MRHLVRTINGMKRSVWHYELFDLLVHCSRCWSVIAAAMVLLGCSGAPFTVAPAADGAEISSEAGAPTEDAGPYALAAEASAADSAGDADRDEAAAKADAGPEVNAFPGSPYLSAKCRGSADCAGDTQFDLWDGEVPPALVCFAVEGIAGNGSTGATTLSGSTQCRPADSVSGGVVLCLSDLDCSGYACITQECVVATYAPWDGGGDAVQTGVSPILVSYCSGIGTVPACN